MSPLAVWRLLCFSQMGNWTSVRFKWSAWVQFHSAFTATILGWYDIKPASPGFTSCPGWWIGLITLIDLTTMKKPFMSRHKWLRHDAQQRVAPCRALSVLMFCAELLCRVKKKRASRSERSLSGANTERSSNIWPRSEDVWYRLIMHRNPPFPFPCLSLLNFCRLSFPPGESHFFIISRRSLVAAPNPAFAALSWQIRPRRTFFFLLPADNLSSEELSFHVSKSF